MDISLLSTTQQVIVSLNSQDGLPAELSFEIGPLYGYENGLSKTEVWMGQAREGKAAQADNDMQPEVSSPWPFFPSWHSLLMTKKTK